MNVDDAVARFIELATSYDGCTAKSDPQRFAHVCAPNGPPAVAAFFLKPNVPLDANSSCEVVAVGLVTLLFAELGMLLLQEPLDSAVGQWSRFTSLADKHAARFTPHPEQAIREACVVHVESAHGRHWYVTREDLGGGTLRTIDGGGLTSDGYQAIASHMHQIRGGSFDVTSGKPVIDWVDMRELLTALLPSDADPTDSPFCG